MTSNKLGIALDLTGAAGSFAVGGGEWAGHNATRIWISRWFWAVRFLFWLKPSLGVFASAQLGVLPCRLQSPGHQVGAGEGACNCWWTCLAADQTHLPELEWVGRKLHRGGEAAEVGSGYFGLCGRCCMKLRDARGWHWRSGRTRGRPSLLVPAAISFLVLHQDARPHQSPRPQPPRAHRAHEQRVG